MLEIKITDIQNIKNCEFSIDLQKNTLMCIVGKNACGKTTLIRSIANFSISDIFIAQTTRHIFKENSSSISYTTENDNYYFTYNSQHQALDCKNNKLLSDPLRDSLHIESTFPYGFRYSSAQKLKENDMLIRAEIAQEKFNTPDKLINFLNNIYCSSKFSNLKEVTVKRQKYYVFTFPTGKYVREDHLSSGEFFLISLFKSLITTEKKIIIIDEIDSSLDAEAQVNLIKELRKHALENNKKIIFTSHSLPLIKTLKDNELFYMENNQGDISITSRSYQFIKSSLFGFKGWDKYILLEDKKGKEFIQYLITSNFCSDFYKYMIIPVGTATSVKDLYKNNRSSYIFTEHLKDIRIILDGDQYQDNKSDITNFDNNLLFLPIPDVEKYLYDLFERSPEKIFSMTGENVSFTKNKNLTYNKNSKKFYNHLLSITKDQNKIFSFICENENFSNIIEELKVFLNPST